MNASTTHIGRALRGLLQRLSPKQRQYAMLAAILCGGVGILWLIFAFAGASPKKDAAHAVATTPSAVTNIGVMAPGTQVNPEDQWVGTAGRKLAQYENERDEQDHLNKDRQAFEARTMQRFAELEQKLTSAQQAAASPPIAPSTAARAPLSTAPATLPPAATLPVAPRTSASPTLPGGTPGELQLSPTSQFSQTLAAVPTITRVSLGTRSHPVSGATDDRASAQPLPNTNPQTITSFLPVSFTRGELLGGLDAPTGGQAQSNPQPVLIRLADNSVLPNQFRGEYHDCFVIAAGYGDISSERAYLRTENLSCVRADGATLEAKIQGSIYGEDGKVGMRGRLVTKQGQMLANALLAGVVGGIGQGLSSASTQYTTSALGTIANSTGTEAYRAGLGSGVGKALDRLAEYYIHLAENTFPIIEVDAGRQIDVVITKGVRIDVPMSANSATAAPLPSRPTSPETHYLEVSNDENY